MAKWLPVPEYENLYEVSDDGQIRSLCGRYGYKNIIKQSTSNKGYKMVCLCNKGVQKTLAVHRIVAKVFIPNPENLPCVNHIDQDRNNNSVSNLEWCSYYYNNVYGDRLTKSAMKIGKPVKCIETGVVYSSAYAAQRETGILQSKISSCCHGRRKTTGKLHWTFV